MSLYIKNILAVAIVTCLLAHFLCNCVSDCYVTYVLIVFLYNNHIDKIIIMIAI